MSKNDKTADLLEKLLEEIRLLRKELSQKRQDDRIIGTTILTHIRGMIEITDSSNSKKILKELLSDEDQLSMALSNTGSVDVLYGPGNETEDMPNTSDANLDMFHMHNEGHSYKEIAEMYDMSYYNAYARINRIRKKIESGKVRYDRNSYKSRATSKHLYSRIPENIKVKAFDLKEEGMSQFDIATELGIGVSTVYYILNPDKAEAHRDKLRSGYYGGKKKKSQPQPDIKTEENENKGITTIDDRIKELNDKGLSVEQISKNLGIAKPYIWKFLNSNVKNRVERR